MSNITKKQRQIIETRIYTVMDTLDKTKTNSEYYKKLFSKMSDDQFYKYISKKYPYKFHINPDIQPTISDISKACKLVNTSLMEKCYLPYYYTNKDGVPVETPEAYVMYLPVKKMQQFSTKKNKFGVDTEQRDTRSGRLLGDSKGAQTSIREAEALAAMGLMKTMDEFSRPRADAMNAKNVMNSVISNKGMVSLEDIPTDKDDSLGKNYLNVYLIGCHLNSNLINSGNYTAYTLKNKKAKVSREV